MKKTQKSGKEYKMQNHFLKCKEMISDEYMQKMQPILLKKKFSIK
jgi:intergrase/recombinase